MDDLLLVPTRNVHHSEKYKHVIEELEKSPEITRLVGHSLASAVIRSIKNNLIDLLQQPMLPLQLCCNFGKLEFWKLPLGEGGLRQNRILSVAQKSIETQYKYKNKIQTK